MGTTSGNPNSAFGSAKRELDGTLTFSNALQRAYDQLELSEKRYRELYDNAPDMYHTLDLEGNFVELNPKHAEVLGYSAEELQYNHISCLLTEEMLPRLEQDFQDLQAFGSVNGREYTLRKKDGSLMPVEVHAMRFDGPDGKPREVLCIMRDITQRKRLEEQLLQSQKMECIGQLAGGIAHDFNNLLTAICGYTQMAMADSEPEAKVSDYLCRINEAADRATTLTRQLLAFSRRQIISPQVISLNQVVISIEQMLRRLITENIELHISLDPDLAYVKMDPNQVEQILINLAVNARDAMPEGGALTVSTQNITLSKKAARMYPDLSAGQFVLLSVIDNGIGMSKEMQSRIFEPFFTTKEEGKGTGLGLAMCYGVVKQNHGHICVESQPGRGSAFKIFVPRAKEKADFKMPEERKGGSPAMGNEAILLVEDDALVRGLGSEVLRQHGYTVLEAADGRDAIQVAREHSGDIQLLLTDVVMPNLSVGELTKELKSSRPDIKVLFTSGYTDDSIIRHRVLEHGVDFIEKPYSLPDLLKRIREVLDQ